MSRHHPVVADTSRLLHRQALRIPLPTPKAELGLHLNMARVAASQERKAEMLLAPDTSVVETYETQLDEIAQSYRDSIERDLGDEFEPAALAYSSGERDDGVAAAAAYLYEAVWRIQQMYTVTDMVVFPIVLRYPNCCTINLRFIRGRVANNVIWFESPEHSSEKLSEEHTDIYHCESQYSQKQAAKQIRSAARVVREQFPDPRETPAEERRLGGIVSAFGRENSTFCSGLEAVTPDPDRFDDSPAVPTIVKEGQLARETESKWLDDDAVVL